jgi:hypothetical protein
VAFCAPDQKRLKLVVVMEEKVKEDGMLPMVFTGKLLDLFDPHGFVAITLKL